MTVLSCFTCSKRRTQAWPVDMVEVYVRMFVTTLCSEFEANFLANFSIMMYAHHTPHTHTTSLTVSHTHSTIQPPVSASQAQEATTSCFQVPVPAVNPTMMHSHRAVLGLWNPSLPPGPNSPLDALSVRHSVCACACVCVCVVCVHARVCV